MVPWAVRSQVARRGQAGFKPVNISAFVRAEVAKVGVNKEDQRARRTNIRIHSAHIAMRNGQTSAAHAAVWKAAHAHEKATAQDDLQTACKSRR
jgi:hypothetical protein